TSIFFVVLAMFLIFIGAFVWVLNLEHIILGPWSTLLSVFFTVLSVILALLQWHTQFSIGVPAYPPAVLPTHKLSSQDHYMYTKGIALGVNRHKGALIIYTKRNLRGATAHLTCGFDTTSLKTHAASNVVER